MRPQKLCRIHFWLAILWGTIGLTYTLVWGATSILWVGLISVYAIVLEHLTAWAAHRAEIQSEQ